LTISDVILLENESLKEKVKSLETNARDSDLKALKYQEERGIAVKEREHAREQFKKLQEESKSKEEEIAVKQNEKNIDIKKNLETFSESIKTV
jgi:rubrerythrin